MKKRVQRLFAGMTAVCLSAGLLCVPASAGATVPEGWVNPFSDMRGDEWYFKFVASLNSQAIITGTPEGLFLPGGTVDAGQAILMVAKAVGVDHQVLRRKPGEPHYASGAARYAVKYGWLTQAEVPADLSTPVDRRYVGRLVAKALDLDPVEGQSPYEDVDDGYLTALCQVGVMCGAKENGKRYFKPDSTLSRAEISATVWNIMHYMESHIYFRGHVLDIDENVPAFPYDKDGFVREGEKLTYRNPKVQTAWGIDVSHHQGDIDWQAVARDGVEFAIIRAAGRGYGPEGNLYEDMKFHKNIQEAQQAGLQVGTYFFSQAITVEEAKEEAAMLVNMLRDYNITGPVVFDSEDNWGSNGRTHGLTPEQLTEIANAFCSEVEKAGYQPMIYFNRSMAYLHVNLADLVQYPFWLAEYEDSPSFYYDFQMWQYTSSGHVNGIKDRVDMNLWFKPTF